jgi:hypothetical protein
MSYELVECCPVPTKLVPVLKQILAESGATLQSCYRAADSEKLLHRCGKHSQAELYAMFLRGQGNPANPPGRSTHELRSDGVAYAGPAGRKLPYWCVGIDIDDSHVQAFIRTAAKHGYTATVTYPGSRSEYHHVNFRKQPKLRLPALKNGASGPRVLVLTRRLKNLGYLTHSGGHYGGAVEAAVRRFQRDHHQHVDGTVGTQTARQIIVAVRQHNKKH